MSYLAIKHLHMTTAAITAVLFLLRGIGMLRASPWMKKRWVKVVPHVNDTLLLASAVTMVVWSGQYPFRHDWLTAKLLLVLAYIAAGMVALNYGKTRGIRIAAFCLALVFLAGIFKLALTRQLGFA